MKKETSTNYPNPILYSHSVGIADLDTDRQKIPMINSVVKKGQIVELYDWGDGKKFVFQKLVIGYEANNSSTQKFRKEHILNVGDTLYINGSSVNIVSIDTTNEDYDVFELSASVTVGLNEIYFWRNGGNNTEDSRFGIVNESFKVVSKTEGLSLDIHYGTLDLYTYMKNINFNGINVILNTSENTVQFVPYYA